MWDSGIGRKRKLRNMLFVVFAIQLVLIIRIGFIQFVQGAELQAMAYSQQTLNRAISPKRGRILDRTGKIELAVSASTETVSVNPTNIVVPIWIVTLCSLIAGITAIKILNKRM